MTSEVSNEDIASALDKVEKESVGTAASSDGAEKEDPKTVKGMLAEMQKHSDGTNVIKESIKTFSNPFGSDKKGDIWVATKAEGVAKLKEMMDADRGSRKEDSKKHKRWDFASSPHEYFGVTLEDTYAAFVQWSLKESEESGDSPSQAAFNISKAFRRIESYADWMHDNADEITETPLIADSIREANKAWGMKSSIDKNGNYVWWIDFKQLDKEAIKNTVSLKDSFRYFVWYAHFVMYNENAQNNGMIFIEAVANVGFIESMTLVPMKLGVKLDRLTIGILPIKIKSLYIFQSPKWMEMFSKVMGLFMSKKMKERMHMIKDFGGIEDIVGKECIPQPFGELEGALSLDLVDAKYFS